MVLYLFVCFQKTSRQSNPAQKKKTKNGEFTFSKDKRPSSTVTIKKLYRVDICDRNTSSMACNEHISSNSDGPTKMQNLSHDRPNVEPMLWAKDGPMSKRYIGPFKIYNLGPIVRRPMGQWRANIYVLSGLISIITDFRQLAFYCDFLVILFYFILFYFIIIFFFVCSKTLTYRLNLCAQMKSSIHPSRFSTL